MSNDSDNRNADNYQPEIGYHYDPAGHADNTPQANDSYTASDLEHLSDQEHVRKRPAMYIGDVATRGLHHLVSEVVDNSIDEALAGFASLIKVTINVDGSVTVEDDGRGIPVEEHPDLHISSLEGVMTVLKFGGKFEKGAYQTSGGLHGVGVTVVNFLSEECQVEVSRDGYLWQQEYVRGAKTCEVTRGNKTNKTGTKTTFKPDPEIFPDTKFDYDILSRRLRDLAFLNHGIKIIYFDERSNKGETFEYANGLVDFVEYLNASTHPEGYEEEPNKQKNAVTCPVIFMADNFEGVKVEIALQYTTDYNENVRSYVNNIHTIEGGTHVSGLRGALTRTLNNYGKNNKEELFKNLSPTGEDFREGLTAVLSVQVPNPRFEGQTKTKLGNSEVEGIVTSIVGEGFAKYLEENPKVADLILKKGLIAAEAREAAKRARKEVLSRKNVLSHGGMPGKLRDCSSRDIDRCELYLVEGDSAGGSAEGGRLREFQAILPLRGKVINAYKATSLKVLANEEVRSMFVALGCGADMGKNEGRRGEVPAEGMLRNEIDLTKRRYGKVVIMTDADVDGSHIRTLLLTFFYRQMYNLVKGGFVYIAQPPLYKVRKKGTKAEARYIQTDEEMRRWLMVNGIVGVAFDPKDGRLIEGETMEKLCKTLSNIEESVIALERRGISLREHAERQDQETAALPIYHVFWKKREYWFLSRPDLTAFLNEVEAETGQSAESLMESDNIGKALAQNIPATSDEPIGLEGGLHVVEMHEVRSLNRQLAELRALGFEVNALFPIKRTGLEGSRYYLKRGDTDIGLNDLRELLGAIRQSAEKGYIITRYKGLGEMDPEELRETTLDPTNRTLVQVKMEDAEAADDLFRVLMGDRVEPRREFIEKYALEVKNLDV